MNPEVSQAASTVDSSFIEEDSNSNLLKVTAERNIVPTRQNRMDPEVFRAAFTGNSSFFEKVSNINFLEVTPEKNTVLHVALQFNQFEVAQKIASLSGSLVLEKNSKGNTPLHIAARVGTSSIVKLLIDGAKKLDVEAGGQQQLLSMVNQDGDTALHIAIRYCNFEIVKELINENDPAELAMEVNNDRESALFLAVDRQCYRIASHILNNAPNISYDGRDGMNVLHALAFRTSNWLEVILGRVSLMKVPLILKKNPEDFMKEVMDKCSSAAIEKRDNSGWTPLDIAAFMGNEKFVTLLLEKELSAAYSKDKDGLSAPLCGQRRPEIKSLINEQDIEGNTPMNLAAIEGHFEIASKLGCYKGVDLNSTNDAGLTTLDNAFSQEKGSQQMKELWVKLSGGQPSLRGALSMKAKMKADPAEPADKKNSNSEADRIMESAQTSLTQTDLLVATLITIVTFAAAITVPGGYRSQGVEEGSVVLSKTKAFHVFLIANSLAFGLSITSVFYNFATTIFKLEKILRSTDIERALIFIGYSILFLIVAFVVSGIYSVVPHSMGRTTAVIVCCCFFSSRILMISDKLKSRFFLRINS